MNSELAESFFRNIYETHTPSSWGDCSVCVDDSDMGCGVDYPCDLYKSAAEILGLPIVEWVRPPRRVLTEEEKQKSLISSMAYGKLVEFSLRPNLLNDFTDNLGLPRSTVTFKIQTKK